MLSVYAISSNLVKISILPVYGSAARGIPLIQTLNSFSFKKVNHERFKHASAQTIGGDPSDLPANSPPDVPTAPRKHRPGTPSGMRRILINEPDFDPAPLEEAADPQPVSPPEPKPPAPSPPGQPEIIPPRGPDIIPPRPPEPGKVIPPRRPAIDPPRGPDVVPPKPPEPGFHILSNLIFKNLLCSSSRSNTVCLTCEQ